MNTNIRPFGDQIPTLPPVPALPPPKMENIGGSMANLFVTAMEGYKGDFNGDGLQLSEGPIEPDDEVPSDPERDAAEAKLRNSAEFQKLPRTVRDTAFMSRKEAISWAKALDNGLKIQVVANTQSGNAATYDPSTKTIYLKQSYVDAASGEEYYGYNSGLLLGSLVHELGHHLTLGQISVDPTTRANYIDGNLTIEAAAIVNNLITYHLLGHQGYDVFVGGGNVNNVFFTFYEQFIGDNNIDSLINKIKSQLLINGTYPDYYGQYWDQYLKP